MKLFLCAGEPSGDQYAAELLKALQRYLPHLEVQAIGGPCLQKQGASLLWNSVSWGAIGVAQALPKIPGLLRVFHHLKKTLALWRPDLLILVDFGAFNVRLARWARKEGFPVCYFIPPGCWRPDGGAYPELAQITSLILTPFQHSALALQRVGANALWVGHPLKDLLQPVEDRSKWLAQRGLKPDQEVIALLPGSRTPEIRVHSRILSQAVQLLFRERPSLQFVIAQAPGKAPLLFEKTFQLEAWRRLGIPFAIEEGQRGEVLSVADIALVCSGTATLEAGLLAIPHIIFYRVSGLSILEYHLRKASLQKITSFIGLPNILAGEAICPELIQEAFTPQRLLEELRKLLCDKARREAIRKALQKVAQQLGEKGTFDRSAQAILQHFKEFGNA